MSWIQYKKKENNSTNVIIFDKDVSKVLQTEIVNEVDVETIKK